MRKVFSFVLAILHILVSFTLMYTVKLATVHDPDITGASLILICALAILAFIGAGYHLNKLFVPTNPVIPTYEDYIP